MRKSAVVVFAALLATGCVAHRPNEVSPPQALGIGLGYLVMSPVLILAGLMEGIATAPYFVSADLHEMNARMEESDARVSLDRTYRYAYDTPLADVPPSGDTGRVFRHMSEATAHFQTVLRGYGVEDAERYVLTAVRTADRAGYTLYALIYRPREAARVYDERGYLVALTPGAETYYRPYARDAEGRPFDVVLDWAGVPRSAIKTQKGQAILLTLAANSVLINRRSDDYWLAEQRWRAGDYEAVVAERKAELDRRMGATG